MEAMIIEYKDVTFSSGLSSKLCVAHQSSKVKALRSQISAQHEFISSDTDNVEI